MIEAWVRRAEQGDASAQCNLGVLYGSGKGVSQDYTEAAQWFQQAAEQGHAAGQFNLGALYRDGRGVTRDLAEAARWFGKAAEQGIAPAQYNLGLMFRDGLGVAQDQVEALKWLSLAVMNAHEERRGKYSEARDLLAQQLPQHQAAEAQNRVRRWKAQTTSWKKKRRVAVA